MATVDKKSTPLTDQEEKIANKPQQLRIAKNPDIKTRVANDPDLKDEIDNIKNILQELDSLLKKPELNMDDKDDTI